MKTVHGRKYPLPRSSQAFKDFKDSDAANIHAIYEEIMLEANTADKLAAVDSLLAAGIPNVSVKTGHEAAVATVQLMFNSQKRLSPKTIINADKPNWAKSDTERASLLWNKATVRNGTLASLADSVQLLADLWTSAWKIGKGNNIPSAKLIEFTEDQINDVCRIEHSTFVPSLSLDAMAESGDFEP